MRQPPGNVSGPASVPPSAEPSGLGHRQAAWAALFVTVLWSSSWVLIRWGLEDEELAPITFAGLRYGLAAAILLAWVLLRRPGAGQRQRQRLDRGQLLQLVLLGILLYALTQGAQFVALAHQPAATTSLVLSLTPMLVALVAALSLAEVPAARQVVGVVLVAVGAVLYFAGDLGATAAGMAAALVGLGANVASSVLGRSVNRAARLSPVIVTAISMSVGAVVLLVAGLLTEGVPAVSPRAWLLIAWLAIVNTAFAFTLWNASLRRLSAVESASLNNTMLIQIALLAWLFLGEDPGLVGLIGILVVSAGVFLAQARRPTTLPA